MGLGVTPYQVLRRGSHSATTSYSTDANEMIAKMQGEIDALTAQVAEVDALKAKVAEVDSLKEQLAFIMSTINKGNHVQDLESPIEARRSPESSHEPEINQAISRGTI